ncbi:PREDICTED: T-cell surface glycoprotein CD3 delta chain [Bison bison bison]|uniref:T-cell surface glycoprotein CD3 delta chain n=1 Tax=Bison bison bison TaxID=43346 RepID=A0A6P3GAS5_BISBB|nr:PREDICTED: T-cell surface glycoprotein CD3 delta chain [Bison bison bison]
MEHSRFLSCLILAALLSQVNPRILKVLEPEDKVMLECNSSITLLQGTEGQEVSGNNKTRDLGKRIQDPRGMYQCGENAQQLILQVYYRMCQNCVELDTATLAGMIITDIIATVLLALGVYCFAGHETGRFSRAADTQALMGNDQLYQPLRERNDAQYSRLGDKWARNK